MLVIVFNPVEKRCKEKGLAMLWAQAMRGNDCPISNSTVSIT
jgi:hypothetical protein